MITAPETLTPREKEVLILVAKGLPYKEIGNEHTIKNQLYSIREKMGAHTTAQAAILAFKQGIIE